MIFISKCIVETVTFADKVKISIYAGRTDFLPSQLLGKLSFIDISKNNYPKPFSQNGLMSDLQKLWCLNYKLVLLLGCMNSNMFFANPSNFGVIRRDYMQFHCH